MRRSFPPIAREQLPFVFSGKRYLLVRLACQVVFVVACVQRLRAGAPLAPWLMGAGGMLMAAGYAVRRWARHLMGERFRGYEVRREEHGLETRGPYRIVRHPGYLGLALMDLGFPLLLGVAWGPLLSIVLVALVVHRIGLEERLLDRTYPEYGAYAAGRKRLIPGVW